jgi:hypothetical protein
VDLADSARASSSSSAAAAGHRTIPHGAESVIVDGLEALAGAGDADERLRSVLGAVHAARGRSIVACPNLDAYAMASRAAERLALTSTCLDVSNTEVCELRRLFDVSATRERTAAKEGVEWVLRSLTSNHKAILETIVEHATVQDAGALPSIELEELFELTSATLTVTSQAVLRLQIGELIDHGIVERRGGSVILAQPPQFIRQVLASTV